MNLVSPKRRSCAHQGWGLQPLKAKFLLTGCSEHMQWDERSQFSLVPSLGMHISLQPSSASPATTRSVPSALPGTCVTCCASSLPFFPSSCTRPRKHPATTLAPPSPQIFPWEHRQRVLFLEKPYTYIYVCVCVQLKIAKQSNPPAPFDMPQGKKS